MDNARRFFEQIRDISYIKNNVLHKEMENIWLECKEKSKPNDGKMDQNDKSNFAKALSGFANTSGGVLIFGLSAKKSSDEVDLVQDIIPITKLTLFESELREKEFRIVERAIADIEYRKIHTDEGKDEGIIVIYIPESPIPAHRSLIDHKFYIRIGGNFVSADISLIESLFFKKLKADINMDLIIYTNANLANSPKKIFYMYYNAINVGRNVARDLYIQFKFARDNKWTVGRHDGFQRRYEENGDKFYEISYDNKVLYPTTTITNQNTPFLMTYKPKPDEDVYPPDFNFEILLCAENMLPKKIIVNESSKKIIEKLSVIGKQVSLLK